MGTVTELGGKSIKAKNATQFLGQDDSHNPLLELARGIEGNAATAQGRGDMLFGGQMAFPVLTAYTDPATGQQRTRITRNTFQTPTTLAAGTTPQVPGSPSTPVGGGPPIVIPPGQPPPTTRPPRPGPGIGIATAPTTSTAPPQDDRLLAGYTGFRSA